jgi:hypothetical protein
VVAIVDVVVVIVVVLIVLWQVVLPEVSVPQVPRDRPSMAPPPEERNAKGRAVAPIEVALFEGAN